MKKFINKSFLFFNVLAVLALVFCYLSPFIDPSKFWLFSFFGLFFPVIFIVNAIFVVLWLLTNKKNAILSTLFMIFGLQSFVNLNFGKQDEDNTGKSLRMASYNLMGSWVSREEKSNTERENYKKFLKDLSPVNVFAVQEATQYSRDIFSEVFPKFQSHDIHKGVVLYTDLHVINKGEIDFGTVTNACLWMDVKMGVDTVRVYGLHLKSNKISHDTQKMADNPDIKEKKTWIGIKGILQKYKNALIIRSEQAKLIAEHINSSPFKVIVLGDFNDTNLSYAYHEIKGANIDAFREAGNGFGSTYAGVIPFLRIDYCLVDKDFSVVNSQVIQSKYSDHYPLISEIKLAQ
ncbi:MAG TPA: endonuclease/exonuclease/phosphatase family protein [Saprospiraceae bacterium]|nr:endonuclease/exonuclease/phosphatase family protein [Saprospiraceae bacterium]MCB9328841.1 endonuclease/exonuclease/phosphatase family protein [Lewinellaceae bacterium]HPQ22103.1 endonuclease/exonuclease/phosphatase family protein [Saprospiraceae bacterium]